MVLQQALERFFIETVELAAGDGVVVAFSGGVDSCALLLGLHRLMHRRRERLWAAHLDHGGDAGSVERAAAAARICRELGVECLSERRGPADWRPGESLEAGGRRLRYEFLETVRRATGSRYVATAHHLDDQAETVALRLLFGSGLDGLVGIRPVRGAVVRPLLELPRADLEAAVREAGLTPVEDPTNRDLALPRNRLRHRVLPRLEGEEPECRRRLAALAPAASASRRGLERRWPSLLEPRPLTPGGLRLPRRRLQALPVVLRGLALAWLHRRAGAPYPAGQRARAELARQLAGGGRVGCDCGGGWRWESLGEALVLRRQRAPTPLFSYTFRIPGEVRLEEAALRMSLRPATSGERRRPPSIAGGSGEIIWPRSACLALPSSVVGAVVRNRRPGDRLRPLGGPGQRRLKAVLIDRRVPRWQRDDVPLLVIDGTIAWAPGVALAEGFRIRPDEPCWLAEVAPLET